MMKISMKTTPNLRGDKAVPSEAKKKQRQAEAKWHRENNKVVATHFSKEGDKDILEWLGRQPSKVGAIRSAVREYMKKH